jgi:hypothetical protein
MHNTLILIMAFSLATTALVIVRQRQRQRALFSLVTRLYEGPIGVQTTDDSDTDRDDGGVCSRSKRKMGATAGTASSNAE